MDGRSAMKHTHVVQQLAQQHTVLILGTRAVGGQTKVVLEGCAPINAEHGVGIANVDYQKHRGFSFGTGAEIAR